MLKFLLESASNEEAAKLWQTLCGLAQREREAGAYLDRNKLLVELRGEYELKAVPDYASDWQKLTQWGKETLEGVTDTIGGKVQLTRSRAVNDVVNQLLSTKLCGIVGTSGTGKSVLSKLAINELGSDLPVLWFGPDQFTPEGFDNLSSRLLLQHPFSDVLNYLPTQFGVVVLDGLERITRDDAFARIKRLLNALRVGQQTSSWLVLISSQSERWEFIQTRLIQIGIDVGSLSMVQIPALTSDELQPVRETFSNLYHIIYRPHLHDILIRPKVLDILAARSESMNASDPEAWAGESDLIRWYWDSVISSHEDGPARAVMLQALAERQADRNEAETPLIDLGPDGARLIIGLERDGVCHRDDSDQIVFAHDLIGDWCRQRVLLSRESTLDQSIEGRSRNPHWHKAIRLYGLHLVEGDEGVAAWSDARNRLKPVADLLLDSVVLAANPRDLLEKLWTTLQDENGAFLRRLLGRFLHVGTYPDPRFACLAGEGDQDVAGWLRANIRLPLWPYWMGMIPFLHDHAQDVVALAPLEVASAASIWLKATKIHGLLRRQAAELALAVGEATWRERLKHPYSDDEAAKKKYSAALAAMSELPDAVGDFVLRACARKLTPEIESGEIGKYRAPGTPVRLPSSFHTSYQRPQPNPWEDGPKYRVDGAFQECCLFSNNLIGVMIHKPAIAREAILATIIEKRSAKRSDPASYSLCREDDGLNWLPRFAPALYNQGPFLSFLIVAPQEALDCIIRLVNFSTERWAENIGDIGPPAFVLTMDREAHAYVGDFNVCSWYRGPYASATVASALMALEEWLYERLRKEECIDGICQGIFENAESCAFLGLLWEIGRFKPELFQGPLRPLLGCAALYKWEANALHQGFNHIGLIGGFLQSEQVKNRIRKWEEMKHRVVNVQHAALHLRLFEDSMTSFFDQVLDNWRQQSTTLPSEHPLNEYLQELIAQFDRNNWKPLQQKDGKEGLQYIPPPGFEKRAIEAEEASQTIVPLMLILQSRRVIDGEALLNPDQVDGFFARLKELNLDNTPNEEESKQRYVATLAGIATLANRHWAWITEDPDRYNWCLSTLLAISQDPPTIDRIWGEHDSSCLDWEDFAAQAIVPFWANDPSNMELRGLVAHRAMSGHYSAVALLTDTAFRHRNDLGEEFDRLISFIIQWAVIRHDINKNKRLQSDPVDVDGWFSEHGKAFIEGTMPSEWGDWGIEAVKNGEPYEASPNRSITNSKRTSSGAAVHPRTDQMLITSAFTNILQLDKAGSDTERKKWLSFWFQALECMAGSQRVCDEEGQIVLDGDIEARDIYRFDRWLADRCVELILEMESAEAPERVWQTIIDLGPPAHRWVETFLSSWVTCGMRSPSSADRFVAEWKRIFDYASESQIWCDRQRAWPNWKDFWLHLLGIDHFLIQLWGDEQAPIVEQMSDRFAKWIPQHLDDRWIARAFLRWLQYSVAKSLRLPAVSWLVTVARDADEYWWDRDELTGLVADIMDKCWRDSRAEILGDSDLLAHFRELVAILVLRQDDLAMDLQDRMSGAS